MRGFRPSRAEGRESPAAGLTNGAGRPPPSTPRQFYQRARPFRPRGRAVATNVDPADPLGAQFDYHRLRLLKAHRVALTVIGVAAVGLTVVLGMALGVSICQVCNALTCNGATAPCPFSIVGQALIVALLMIESILVSISLSSRAVARVTLRLGVYGIGSQLRVDPDPRTRTLALFLGPFGFSLVTLGVLLPFSQAGCLEVCDYQSNLTSYPIVLIGAGALLSAVSCALGLRLSSEGRRGLRSRPA